MTESCKIEGKIEEVEKLLAETTSNKAYLEKRLQELKDTLTPNLKEIGRIFREFNWYGFVSCEQEDSGWIFVTLNPTNELHWNGVAGPLNKLGYHIHSLEDYKDIVCSTYRYRAPTKVVLVKN